MIDDPHSLLGIAHAEDEHVEDGGDVEDEEDSKGHHQGGLGHCQWIRRLAKLAGVRIFDTESAPEDIEDISEGGTRLRQECRNEDDVVHQALHRHVETVGISQHLDVQTSNGGRQQFVILLIFDKLCNAHLGKNQGNCFEKSERV